MGLNYKTFMRLPVWGVRHSVFWPGTGHRATQEAGQAVVYVQLSREAYWPVELEQAWTLDVKTPSKASTAVQPLHTTPSHMSSSAFRCRGAVAKTYYVSGQRAQVAV